MTMCRTFRGMSYVTDYFTLTLSESEVASYRELVAPKYRRKLKLAILDDLMRLYAADRFYSGEYN